MLKVANLSHIEWSMSCFMQHHPKVYLKSKNFELWIICIWGVSVNEKTLIFVISGCETWSFAFNIISSLYLQNFYIFSASVLKIWNFQTIKLLHFIERPWYLFIFLQASFIKKRKVWQTSEILAASTHLCLHTPRLFLFKTIFAEFIQTFKKDFPSIFLRSLIQTQTFFNTHIPIVHLTGKYFPITSPEYFKKQARSNAQLPSLSPVSYSRSELRTLLQMIFILK